LIDFEHADKWFGSNHVLRDVTLRIEPGQRVVVCGPSGSGKSTLIRCVNGLETLDRGKLVVEDVDVTAPHVEWAPLRQTIGMVFQQFNLYPHRTVLDNVTLAPTLVQHVPKDEAHALAMGYLRRVGIESKASAYPAELSGGQQQRVAIARALAMRPKIMLFDEPTSALDPEMIQEVLDVMIGVAHEDMTMMVVTHEMGFAAAVADRVVFVDAGEIVEDLPPKDFFERPRSERARTFLSKILKH
jgi:ABC-type polar amino acid transport system ATPase subunit